MGASPVPDYQARESPTSEIPQDFNKAGRTYFRLLKNSLQEEGKTFSTTC